MMTLEILGLMANPIEIKKAKEEKAKAEKKRLTLIRQRIIGLFMLIFGMITPFITYEGIVASLLCIPFGMAMLISKEVMISD